MLLVTLIQSTAIACCLITTLPRVQGLQLGEYINHFDPLFYDSIEVHQRHMRTKRSIYDKIISLPLRFNSKKLDLTLYPADDGIFHPNAKISMDGSESAFDNSHLFSGYIKGDQGSSISGSIINGVFQGMIKTGSKDVFYVDRKEYHPTHPLTKHEKVHSVIYNKRDVDTEKFNRLRRDKRGANSDGFCGLRFNDVAKQMADVEASGQQFEDLAGRSKRATPSKNTCNLFLQSDPEMWKHFKSTLQNADDSIVAQEISALFNDLIKEVDGIFKKTNFNGQNGFRLRVDRLAINKTCKGSNDHWFCTQDLDVGNFLNLNTYTDHDAYCLSYILTYRDFADGTLGLAWVAKVGSRLGGVCSKYTTYSEAGSTRKKSLNTGIVTVKNYGERVPKLMSQLTLAHEIGHNFGSEHDSVGKCTPYTQSNDKDGNFIMYYAAISGKRPNNHEFSSCSNTNMSKVLSNSINTECFKENTGSWCGNQLRETGEACDCGYKNDCPADDPDCCRCCVGQNNNGNDPTACKLKDDPLNSGNMFTCDPSQGPCCASSCGYQGSSVVCQPPTECANVSTCDGSSVACPAAPPRPNNTPCNINTQVCWNGECDRSICTTIGSGDWTECSIAADEVPAAALCTVSCADNTGKCYSSYETRTLPQDFLNMLNNVNLGKAIKEKPGQMCNKDQGFCDYFHSCRMITDLGPLARLKGLLLKLTSTQELVAWLKQYWWVVLLSILGLVGFMVLLVKFGSVFTPSSNPDKNKARKLSKPFTKPDKRRERPIDPAEVEEFGMQRSARVAPFEG